MVRSAASLRARMVASLVLATGFVLACHVRTVDAVAFADTCACPDPSPCPSFCEACDSYDSDCISGKTNARCNGEDHENCPDGYEKRAQTGSIWRCSSGGKYWTMYHCYRECLGITTGRCNRCQDGYYGFDNNQTCALCEPGRYCTDGVDQGECDAGYYCEAGSASRTDMPCPPGTFGESTGLEDSSCSGPCQAGYWCESGSTSATQHACIAGQWGGSGQTNEYCSGPCSAGYYCPAASSTSKAVACGSAAVYCPEGSADPVSVDVGFYSSPTSVAENVRTSQTICPKGSYCSAGKKNACPAGNYAPSIGLSSCAEYVCAAGYFCPEGSTSSTAGPCYEGSVEPEHPAMYYCPEGADAPLTVLDGYYSTPESSLEIHRSGMELADASLYIVKYGKRMRKVEWKGTCAGDVGAVSLWEVTNDGYGTAKGGHVLTRLNATDNIVSVDLEASSLSFEDSDGYGLILPFALNKYECMAWVEENGFPFEITGANELVIRSDLSLNYEICPTYVFDIKATSVNETTTSATCRMTIQLENSSDKPYFEYKTTPGYPFALPSVLDFEVEERSPSNTGVGSPIRANDEDVGQDISFEIIGDTFDGPELMFYIGSCSGQLYVQNSGLDYIAKNIYHLQVRVCDDYQFFGADTDPRCSVTANITIHVLDVNDTPYWITSPYEITSFRVPENSPDNTLLIPYCGDTPCADLDASIVGLQVGDLDLNADGSSVTDRMLYSIERNVDDFFAVVSCAREDNLDECPVTEELSAPAGTLRTTAAAALNYELKNTYTITVRVNDGRGGTNTRDVDIVVTDANDAPEWPSAQSQATLQFYENAEFDENSGRASGYIFAMDEDAGDMLTYSVLSAKDANDVDATSLFEMENGNSVTAQESELVTLQLTSGSTLDYEASETYTVTVIAVDAEGANSTFDFTVYVRDVNESPQITTTTLSVPENVPFGTVLEEAITFTDVDAGQSGFFSLEPGRNASFFAVAGSTGEVSVRGDLDYETQDTYQIIVGVTDNGVPSIKTTAVINIQVTDEPEPPTFGDSLTYTVTETPEIDDTWVANVDVTDEDGSPFTLEILSQVIASTGKAVDYFAVDGTTLVQNSLAASPPNFESSLFTTYDDKNIKVTLYAEDDGGLNSTATVIIAVLDANDRPVLANTSVSVPKHVTTQDPSEPDRPYEPGFEVLNVFELCSDEDLDDDERVSGITYAIVSGNGQDTFELVDGVLIVKNVSDHVKTEDYVFTLGITATDHEDSPLTSEVGYVEVTVTGENYPPKIESHTLTLTENESDFAVIIEDIQASDPEDSENLVFEIAEVFPSYAAPAFYINPSNGTLFLVQTLDYETMTDSDGTLTLTIRVRDNGGDQANSLSALGTVTITVIDVNEPPEFEKAEYAISVDEMTSAGDIGDPIVAVDPDSADVGELRYILSSSGVEPFALDLYTGQLSISGELDFENPQGPCSLLAGAIHKCSLNIAVTDAEGLGTSTVVTITVVNINEQPSFDGTRCSDSASYGILCEDDLDARQSIISIPESIYDGSEIKVATLKSSDPDKISGYKLSFAVAHFVFDQGVELETGETLVDDLFQLDDSGALYLVGALDFENRSRYTYQVTVSDEGNSVQASMDAGFVIRIAVLDDNDLSPVSATTAETPWPTAGGASVTLDGSNLGPTQYKFDAEGAGPSQVRAYLVQKGTLRTFEAEDCVVVSNTQVTCDASPTGVGSELFWMVSFPDEGQNSTLDFDDDALANRFQDPIITSVLGASALPTSGGATFTLQGSDFGAADLPFAPDVEVRYRSAVDRSVAYHAQNCLVESSTAISCESAVGTGPQLEFMVTVQGQQALSWHSGEYTHVAPSISTVRFEVSTNTVMQTKGGTSADAILLEGSNFGPIGTSIVVTYGPLAQTSKFTATSCEVLVAHTVVRCVYIAGSGTDLRFVVAANSVRSTASSAGLSYAGPSIEGITGSGSENARTSGGDTVYISGNGFGPVTTADGTVVAQYGGANATKYTATECAVITEDTQISCKTASGTGKDHPWRVTISGQSSEATPVEDGLIMSYSAPTINYFEGTDSDAVTDGGDSVTLVGLDFGFDSSLIRVTFGATGVEYEARDCTIDPDYLHSKIDCELPPGIGKELKWTVTVDGQASKVPTTAYRAPEIDSLAGALVDNGATTKGGETFIIYGSDFGPRILYGDGEDQFSFTYGGSSGKKYTAANCAILAPEPSLLTTSVSSNADNATLTGGTFTLSVDGETTAALAHDAGAADVEVALRGVGSGVLFNVTREAYVGGGYLWAISTPSMPRESITVDSSNLVASEGAATASVDQPELGSAAALCTTVAGVGASLRLVATVASQPSNLSTAVLSYKPPEITSFRPALGVSGSDFTLNVSGTNFGNEGVSVSFAGVVLSGAEVDMHTSVAFSIPGELQRNRDNALLITVGGQTVQSAYSFSRPEVASITAINPPEVLDGPPQGVLVRGTGFGEYHPELGDSITVGGEPCLLELWTHEAIQCNLTTLEGEMVINVGEQTCEDDEGRECCPCDFSFEELLAPPTVYSISACGVGANLRNCTTDGGYTIIVRGENLGSGLYGKVYIGDETENRTCAVADPVADYTETEIVCTVPPGEGRDLRVTVHHAWQRSEDEITFSYDQPHLTDVTPDAFSTVGNATLVISGSNFGNLGPEVQLWANGNSSQLEFCEVVYFDHNSIECLLPEGQGPLVIAVRVGDQDSSSTLAFSYFAPFVETISPVEGSAQGGYLMTVSGRDFGVVGKVFVGDNECEAVGYSHTTISCTVPGGAGADLSVFVESGGYTSNTNHTFTYLPPEVHSLSPGSGPTNGGEELWIYGANFHPTPDLAVSIGGFPCTNPIVHSADAIECSSPEGVGERLTVSVTVGGQISAENTNEMALFSFDAPLVSNVVPDPADARGGIWLELRGQNFGSDGVDPDALVNVMIGGTECENPSRSSHTRISCRLQPVRVGDNPINLTVALQEASIAAEDGVFAACTANYYGQPGEYCLDCPYGAMCLGYVNGWHYEPASIAGFGSLNRSVFQECIPTYACLGNSTCAEGYIHSREDLQLCGKCDEDFYRLEGDCVPCPNLAWLILIACFLVAVMLCSIAYFLTKYGVQLAAVSICIDFCQVVSLFSTYDFAWPRVVSGAYAVLSAFNLNLELASPECSVGWDYETKWYIMYFMPVVFGFMFTTSFIIAFVKLAYRKLRREVKLKTGAAVAPVVLKPDANDNAGASEDEKVLLVDDDDMESYDASFNKFIDAEFGAFLLMCYYLYMSVMKKCFEVYRCSDGSGGRSFLLAEPAEPCDASGEFYPRIHALGGLGIFVYGIGIPGVISYLLLKHRNFIKHDQQRREQALKLSESEAAKRLQSAFRGYYVRRVVDPRSILRQHKKLTHIGRTRAKFGKLYEDFTSECYYWRLVLMLRKLLLSIISLFLDDKFKQSTLAFGVLFSSYALQVKLKPYLSRFPDDLHKRRQAKAYKEWKRRAELRSEVNRTKGRVRALQLAVSAKMKRMGINVAKDQRLIRENMDFTQLEISKGIPGRVQQSRESKLVKAVEDGVLEADQLHGETPAQRHWAILRHFVTEMDNKDKFELNEEAAKYLDSDALRWIFDYNTLETISLATLMYILLFGLLFDTYAEQADDARINALAGITIALFVMVIVLFMSSVVIDVKRKFWPVLRERFIREGVRGLVPLALRKRLDKLWGKRSDGDDGDGDGAGPKSRARGGATVAPARDSAKAVLTARRGQWVSQVNPFATLERQNADLVRAEEARLQAILASKMRFEEELRERELKRQQKKERLEEEYRLKMESVDAELRELEEQEAAMLDALDSAGQDDEEAALLAARDEAALEVEQALGQLEELRGDTGLPPEDVLLAKGASSRTKLAREADDDEASEPEETEEALHEKREEEARALEEEHFTVEQEVVLAKLEAEEREQLVQLKTRQNDEINAAIADLQRQADEVFAGHRNQQDEIKARLQERKLRRGTTVRRRRRQGAAQGGLDEDGAEDDVEAEADGADTNAASELTEEQELLVRKLEDQLAELHAKQDREKEDFAKTLEARKAQELEGLREQIRERVEREVGEEAAFERQMVEELERFQEETKTLVAEIAAPGVGEFGGAAGEELSDDEAKRVREQYATSMAALKERRNGELAALREKLERKRKDRIEAATKEEESREEERLRKLEEAEASKLLAQQKEMELAEQQQQEAAILQEEQGGEGDEDAKAAVEKLRETFELASSELERKQDKLRKERREALERRLESRKRAIEQRNQKKLEAAIKKEDKVFTQALKPAEPVEEDPEVIAARLEQIKKDAMAKKAALDTKIRNEKSAQRDRMRERLAKKRQQAEEKKEKMLQDKAAEEELMNQKLKEEEAALRERQAIELQEIEEANVEAFMDETQAASLAAGVSAWRKRREEQEQKQAAKGPTRSEILAADFADKAKRIEDLSTTANDDEKAKKEAARLLKDLESLFVNLVEETDAELNKLTNEAAVQKARQKRQLRDLRRRILPNSDPASPNSPEDPGSPLDGKQDGDRAAEPVVNVNLDKITFLDL